MNDLLGSLLGGNLIPGFSVQRDEMLNVQISIPRDHPKAMKLLALAEELATRQVLPSGIIVDYAPKIHDDRLMALLRDIVDVDAIMNEAARRHREEKEIRLQQDVSRSVADPAKALKATADILKGAHAVLPLTTDEKDRVANVLQERGVL
jgi:hypothetical protein